MEQFSPNVRSAFRRMWRMGYGTFRGVHVRDGDLAPDPPYAVIRTVRFPEAPVPCRADSEVRVKREHLAFAAELKAIGDGFIDVIKVHDGLPVGLEISEQP